MNKRAADQKPWWGDFKAKGYRASLSGQGKENNSYKKAIARKALDFIPPNSSMIIGTGSTTFELANLLCMKSGFKIFTDSLPVASVLIESDNGFSLWRRTA